MDIVSPAEIQLACKALGKPNPTVYWSYDDHIISNETSLFSYLTVNIYSVDESGYYQCTARNKYNSTTISVKVTVQGKAVLFSLSNTLNIFHTDPPLILCDPVNNTAFSSEIADFKCSVSGYPLPDIVWIKDGIELNTFDNDKYEQLIEVFGNETEKNSTLVINDIEPSDGGFYWCKANNTLFRDLEKVSVQAALDVLCK